METTQEKCIRVCSKSKQISNLVSCGSRLDEAIIETLPDYSDRQEFCFRFIASRMDILEYSKAIAARQDIKLAEVYFFGYAK